MVHFLMKIPGPWGDDCHATDFATLSLSILWKTQCARNDFWKDVIFAAICIIVFPAGLAYVAASQRVCGFKVHVVTDMKGKNHHARTKKHERKKYFRRNSAFVSAPHGRNIRAPAEVRP
jgi:hypothetical protein